VLQGIQEASPVSLERQLRSRPCGKQLAQQQQPPAPTGPQQELDMAEVLSDIAGFFMVH